MTDQSSKDRVKESGKQPATVSRRALLRGGVTAMPAILTLQSGAALAVTSNLISASAQGTTDGLGRTMCLDTNSVTHLSGNVFDLEEPPSAKVTIIPDRDYRVEDNNKSGGEISEGAMCESDATTFYYNENGWQPVEVPSRGIVVSREIGVK